MKTIKDCFKIILSGDFKESRLAARQVRKLLYGSRRTDDYKDIKVLVDTAPEEYKKISEAWRQENFVVAVLVIYYLHDFEDQPDRYFPWLIELLLQANGYVRHAAVRMLTHELGPLTVHLRIPNWKPFHNRGIKPEEAEVILLSLYMQLQKLLADLWKPGYRKYKYISSLPPSPYKSIQLVMAALIEDSKPMKMDF